MSTITSFDSIKSILHEQNLAELYENRVKNWPDQVAYIVEDGISNQSLTYSQVDEHVQKIASYLSSIGVKANDRVAIYAPNSVHWLMVDWAIIYLGAVSVPIYATNLKSNVDYITKDADAKVIFTGTEQQAEVALELLHEKDSVINNIVCFEPTDFKEITYIEDIISSTDLAPAKRHHADVNDLVTLIYTSGTTGEPKGVMLTHNNLLSMAALHDEELDLNNVEDLSLCFLPLSHIFEKGWSSFLFHRGIRNVVLSDPKLVAEALKKHQPTAVCSVPRLYEKIYHAVWAKMNKVGMTRKVFNYSMKVAEKRADKLKANKKVGWWLEKKFQFVDKKIFAQVREQTGGRLKTMPCGGAALPGEITRFFHLIGLPIIKGYGLTETSATVTMFKSKFPPYDSVGKTINKLSIKIGDNDEIMVKGPTVMKGYYNKPEATAKVFEDGWFKTGDAGFIDDQGNLFVTDRIKDLIKTSGGKYIAPQQLEGAFLTTPLIEQIAIIGEGMPYVTALVVPQKEALKDWSFKKLIGDITYIQLLKNEKVLDMYQEIFDNVNQQFARYEQIKKFILIDRPFSMEKGELTPTLKIKRNVVRDNFKKEIKRMYES